MALEWGKEGGGVAREQEGMPGEVNAIGTRGWESEEAVLGKEDRKWILPDIDDTRGGRGRRGGG